MCANIKLILNSTNVIISWTHIIKMATTIIPRAMYSYTMVPKNMLRHTLPI